MKYRLITKKEMDNIKKENFKNMTFKELEKARSSHYELWMATRNKYHEACVLYLNDLMRIRTEQHNAKASR